MSSKIVLNGAGSAEFTKELLADILGFEELADVTIALRRERRATADRRGDRALDGRRPRRAGADRVTPRSPSRPRRRRPRHQHDPRGRPRGARARLPRPRPARDQAGDGRHARDRQLFRALHDPFAARVGQGHLGAMPAGVAVQLHEPDGGARVVDLRRNGPSPCRRRVHVRAEHRRAAGRARRGPVRRGVVADGWDEPPGLAAAIRARRTRSLPAARRGDRPRSRGARTPRPGRDLPAVRPVPLGIQRAQRGSRSLVPPHEGQVERFRIPVDEYLHRSERNLGAYEEVRRKLAAGEPLGIERGPEYAPQIIHSIETGIPRTVYGNVRNAGSIRNLPEEACVEVPRLVDRAGVQPTSVGRSRPGRQR